MLQIVLIGLSLGIVPGVIAAGKGHSFVGWWLFGALLFIVALPMAILAKPNTLSRPCPFCRATIPAAATVCSHCTREVPIGTRPIKCPSCGAQNIIAADLSGWTCSGCGIGWSLSKESRLA